MVAVVAGAAAEKKSVDEAEVAQARNDQNLYMAPSPFVSCLYLT